MPLITNYSTLQTKVEDFLSHTNYTSQIPTFIQLFEAAANRRLRVRQMEATISTAAPVNGAITLPTDFLSHRDVTWLGASRVVLEYVTPSYLQAAYPTLPTGEPRVFTITGENLLIRPLDTALLRLDYYQKIPALATTDPNWLLTGHPDLYLFGTLCEAQAFGVDDDRFPLWKMRRDEIFDEISALANKSRGQGGMRVMTATP